MEAKNRIGAALALIALLGLIGVMGVLLFRGIPEDNQQLVNIALMALVGLCGTAFGYFLGSSADTAKKAATPLPAPGDETKLPGS